MLLEPLLILWLNLYASAATTKSADSVNPLTENSGESREKKIEKRQYPWGLPQAFPNLIFFPSTRTEGWRYYPCRSYPSFPAYPPSPSLPPSTPPSSPADDPNDILDRMGGGEGEKNKDEPSRCVWAVVACCSPGSRDIRYSCFELLGCPGAFWDVNPCEEKVVMAAANSALNFYSGKNSTETTTTTAAPN